MLQHGAWPAFKSFRENSVIGISKSSTANLPCLKSGQTKMYIILILHSEYFSSVYGVCSKENINKSEKRHGQAVYVSFFNHVI